MEGGGVERTKIFNGNGEKFFELYYSAPGGLVAKPRKYCCGQEREFEVLSVRDQICTGSVLVFGCFYSC